MATSVLSKERNLIAVIGDEVRPKRRRRRTRSLTHTPGLYYGTAACRGGPCEREPEEELPHSRPECVSVGLGRERVVDAAAQRRKSLPSRLHFRNSQSARTSPFCSSTSMHVLPTRYRSEAAHTRIADRREDTTDRGQVPAGVPSAARDSEQRPSIRPVEGQHPQACAETLRRLNARSRPCVVHYIHTSLFLQNFLLDEILRCSAILIQLESKQNELGARRGDVYSQRRTDSESRTSDARSMNIRRGFRMRESNAASGLQRRGRG